MKPAYQDDFVTLYNANAASLSSVIPERSVHMCVTSPPYFGLRSYLPADHPQKGDELGAERTPEEYVEKMVAVFREVRKVLRDDGTLWLNIGDSYAANRPYQVSDSKHRAHDFAESNAVKVPPGMKPKDLIGIPWMLAFALRADGWYLRSEITWEKPNPMPESVTDRPTSSTEKVFLFSKSPRYFYDQEAVREPNTVNPNWNYGSEDYREVLTQDARKTDGDFKRPKPSGKTWDGLAASGPNGTGRNMRNLWRIATKPYAGAHFAVFPPELPERCIKAGTSERGVCSECGAPWRRVVERTAMEVRPSERLAQRKKHDDVNDARTATSGTMTKPPSARTIGWEPTCTHDADTVPATVLDPFMGSGTTALVARKLGRRSVGVDIDERNTALLEERLGYQGVLL